MIFALNVYHFFMRKLVVVLCISLSFFSCRKQSTAPETLPNAYSDQGLGKSANDLLSAGKYTALVIQVQYMGGYALDSATLTNVTSYLGKLCNKPGGISITQTPIAATGDTLNVDKVAILERQFRTAYTGGTTLALYVMVTDGYDNSLNVLGFAYRNTSICLFGKNVFDHSGSAGEVTRVSLESSVLEHELGHLLGLVNLGSPMVTPHQDTANGNHCTNPNCLMYWAIETHGGFHSMITKIPVLDSNCLKDLQANGGK